MRRTSPRLWHYPVYRLVSVRSFFQPLEKETGTRLAVSPVPVSRYRAYPLFTVFCPSSHVNTFSSVIDRSISGMRPAFCSAA